jgi:hypothetical protein
MTSCSIPSVHIRRLAIMHDITAIHNVLSTGAPCLCDGLHASEAKEVVGVLELVNTIAVQGVITQGVDDVLKCEAVKGC